MQWLRLRRALEAFPKLQRTRNTIASTLLGLTNEVILRCQRRCPFGVILALGAWVNHLFGLKPRVLRAIQPIVGVPTLDGTPPPEATRPRFPAPGNELPSGQVSEGFLRRSRTRFLALRSSHKAARSQLSNCICLRQEAQGLNTTHAKRAPPFAEAATPSFSACPIGENQQATRTTRWASFSSPSRFVLVSGLKDARQAICCFAVRHSSSFAPACEWGFVFPNPPRLLGLAKT
jgi:hypothetical protein